MSSDRIQMKPLQKYGTVKPEAAPRVISAEHVEEITKSHTLYVLPTRLDDLNAHIEEVNSKLHQSQPGFMDTHIVLPPEEPGDHARKIILIIRFSSLKKLKEFEKGSDLKDSLVQLMALTVDHTGKPWRSLSSFRDALAHDSFVGKNDQVVTVESVDDTSVDIGSSEPAAWRMMLVIIVVISGVLAMFTNSECSCNATHPSWYLGSRACVPVAREMKIMVPGPDGTMVPLTNKWGGIIPTLQCPFGPPCWLCVSKSYVSPVGTAINNTYAEGFDGVYTYGPAMGPDTGRVPSENVGFVMRGFPGCSYEDVFARGAAAGVPPLPATIIFILLVVTCVDFVIMPLVIKALFALYFISGRRTFNPFAPPMYFWENYEPFYSFAHGCCCYAPGGLFGQSVHVQRLTKKVEDMELEMSRRVRTAEQRLDRLENGFGSNAHRWKELMDSSYNKAKESLQGAGLSGPITLSTSWPVRDDQRQPFIDCINECSIELKEVAGVLDVVLVKPSEKATDGVSAAGVWTLVIRFTSHELMDSYARSDQRAVMAEKINHYTAAQGKLKIQAQRAPLEQLLLIPDHSGETGPPMRPPRWKNSISVATALFTVIYPMTNYVFPPCFLWNAAPYFSNLLSLIAMVPIVLYFAGPLVGLAMYRWLNAPRPDYKAGFYGRFRNIVDNGLPFIG